MSAATDEMVRLYAEGYSLADIGERFGVTRQRIHQLIGGTYKTAHGGRLRREAYEQKIRSAHARILEGVSTVNEEAENFGIKPNSLRGAFSIRKLRLPRKTVPLHGSYYRYQQGCRCDECRQARRDYLALLRARGPREHGTITSYRLFACRCDLCKQEGARINRRDRQRRKESKPHVLPAD